MEGVGRFLLRPAPCSAQFKDRHPIRRRIMRSFVGIHPQQPGILDADFLYQKCDFLAKTIVFRFELHASIQTVGRPTAGVDDGCVLGQGDDNIYAARR